MKENQKKKNCIKETISKHMKIKAFYAITNNNKYLC